MRNFIPSIVLVLIGAILLYYGFQESQSLGGELEEAITGSPPDRSLAMIIGGLLLIGIGGGVFFRFGRK